MRHYWTIWKTKCTKIRAYISLNEISSFMAVVANLWHIRTFCCHLKDLQVISFMSWIPFNGTSDVSTRHCSQIYATMPNNDDCAHLVNIILINLGVKIYVVVGFLSLWTFYEYVSINCPCPSLYCHWTNVSWSIVFPNSSTQETLAGGQFLSVINILMQLRKVCNHPNLFETRPTISPFLIIDEFKLNAPRQIFIHDYFANRHSILPHGTSGLADMALNMPKFVADRILKLQSHPNLIEEVDSLNVSDWGYFLWYF